MSSGRFARHVSKLGTALWAMPLSALGVVAFVSLTASCAANDENDATSPDSNVVPSDAGNDATPGEDAGIDCKDGGDPRCTTVALSCDEADWCPTATPLAGHTLLGVWGSKGSDVWAVGSAGTILHFDGTTWVSTPNGVDQTTYRTVWGSGAGDVWVGASRTVLLHGSGFQSGSAEWTKQPAIIPSVVYGGEPTLLTIWGTTANDVWLGGDPAPPDYSTVNSQWHRNGAEEDPSWTPATLAGNTPQQTPPIRAIWGSSADDVWAVGGGDNLYFGIYRTRGKTFHASGKDENGQLVWSEVDSQSLAHLYGVWGSSADDVWAVGKDGTLRHFGKGDIRWQIVDSPTTEHLYGVWGSAADDVWAVGEHGTILHYDGTAWKPSTTALSLGIKPALYGVWGSGPNDVWIVGEGQVLHFTGPKAGKK